MICPRLGPPLPRRFRGGERKLSLRPSSLIRGYALKQRVVAANACSQYAQMSCRRSRRIGSLVVPRLEPQRQFTRLSVDHNGAESLYDRVGQRIKLCHLAFYLTAFLRALSALN